MLQNDCGKFRSNGVDCLLKIEKVNNWLFFGQFRLFLESQFYDIFVIAHIGPPYKVKWLSKFSFESLRQFLKKIVTVHNWRFFGRF